jgi:hypothetical protein
MFNTFLHRFPGKLSLTGKLRSSLEARAGAMALQAGLVLLWGRHRRHYVDCSTKDLQVREGAGFKLFFAGTPQVGRHGD